jgi:hypothetical protein
MSMETVQSPPKPLPRRRRNPPATGIGSVADNQAFLSFLQLHGDTAMIERGCCLCRQIGHSFEVGCLL